MRRSQRRVLRTERCLMNVKVVRSFLVAATFVLTSGSVFAHHGTFVSYDSDHPVTMKAVVTEFRYTNPHIQLYFDVKDEKGGTEITITVAPARNGKPVGTMSDIKLPNGDSVCGLGGGRGAENCRAAQ